MADDMDIHVVKPGFHRSAQACSSKFKGCKETVLDFVFIIGNRIELAPLFFSKGRAVKPSLVFFHVICHGFRPPDVFMVVFKFVYLW